MRISAKIAAAAANSVKSTTALAGNLRDYPLDGPAGRKWYHEGANRHDPEHCRDHQQQSAKNIGTHYLLA